ncbi:formin-like protein 14 [Alosa sapidissima]|uniref:formin-like protein 14 n=1 Tax=Alosa sapidissima TaxID=34773 RepID=UPI001C09CDF2|nr:formin-like protein 14 [Alosa sapidissima]
MYTCSPKKFVFTLPKGFCKNDKNHDVRLKVEAVLLSDSGAKEASKAGEGFFAIYPRTNAPRINLFAGPDEELYQYSGIMALLRAHDDHLAMHCGRLLYTVAFHETRPVAIDRSIGRLPPPPAAQPGDDGTGGQGQEKPDGGAPPSSSGPSTCLGPPLPPEENGTRAQEDPEDFRPSPPPSPQTTEAKLISMEPDVTLDEDGESLPLSPRSGVSRKPELITKLPPRPCGDGLILLPLEDTPPQSPLPLPYTHVIESPRCRGGIASSLPLPCGHVSRPGELVACVIVHGATSLPPLRDGGVPQPFASLRETRYGASTQPNTTPARKHPALEQDQSSAGTDI